MDNWNDLKFVLETVRHGGLSGAARALGVNHATVSRRINAAEETIGALLFDRLPGGYTPTEAGLDAARAAELMEEADAELKRSIGSRDKALSGALTVTAPQLLFANILNPILIDFLERYPEIELTVLASNETLNLSRREADVAIRISKEPNDTLFGSRVAEQRSAIFASRDYVKRLEVDPESKLDWLMFLHWHDIPEDVKALWPNTRVAMKFDDMVAVLSAIRAGLGASRMPCFLGDRDPDLIRLEGLPTYSYPSIWVLTHAELRRMERVKIFMEFTSSRIRKLKSVFNGTSPGV
ncbi:MAG: LysR family transcriptional regulator [Stappiaceae bacterium]